MKRHSLFVVLVLLMSFLMISCSENNALNSEANFDPLNSVGEASFLLVDNEDPMHVEMGPAFLLDGPGPFFFWALDLTEDQKEQLREIGKSFREEFRALHEEWRQGDVTWEEIQEQRKALHQEMREEMLTVLTEAQKQILEEIQEQLDQGIYPTIVIEKKVEFLTEKLSLTEDQQAAIAELLAEYGAELLAARQDSDNPREFRRSMIPIIRQLNREISALLSDEQLEAWKELKAKFRDRFRDRRPGGHHGGPGGPGPFGGPGGGMGRN